MDGTGVATSVYDGAGQRVVTISNGTMSIMVYDAGGKLVAEYGTQSSAAGGTQYVFADHQGSTRVAMNQSGGVLARHDYQPFGEEIYSGVGMRSPSQGFDAADSVRHKYAGMEKDEASGMSHTLWRKYDSQSGRWTSPDPYGGSIEIISPQSFNRYTYVQNDPVNKVDPLGLMLMDSGSGNYSPQDLLKWVESQALIVNKYGKPTSPTRIGESPQEGPQTKVEDPCRECASSGNVVVVNTNQCKNSSLGDRCNNDGSPVRSAPARDIDDHFRALNNAFNIAGAGAGIGEYSNVLNGRWMDNYGNWRPMSTPGNQYIGGKNAAITRAKGWKLAGKATFGISVGMSLYQAYQGGSKTKAAADIGMAYVGTLGPVGLTLSGIYFAFDATIGWENAGEFVNPTPKFPIYDNGGISGIKFDPSM